MKRFLLLSLAITSVILCLSGCHNRQNTLIEGKIQNTKAHFIYLYKVTPDEIVLIDSSKITNHKFDFNPSVTEIGFYQLALTPENNVAIVLEPHKNIKVNIKDSSLVASTEIEGSEDNKRIRNLDLMLLKFGKRVDSLMVVYNQNIEDDSARAQVETTYLEMCVQHRNDLDEFLHQNPNSIVQIMAFYQRFNRHFFYSENEDSEILKKIYTSLNKQYPENSNVKFLGGRVR